MQTESRFAIIRRILAVAFQKPLCMAGSVLLAVISSLSYFVPYLAVWQLLQTLLTGAAEGGSVLRLGVIAFLGAAVNVLAYFASLMLSHVAAFQTAYDLRLSLAGKLARLPLGWHMAQGTGKQFHLMGAGTEKIQSFIAHKLPDMVASVVYPMTMVMLMLAID